MGRLLAIVLVLGAVGVFLVIHDQGVDRAFGGALQRFTKKSAPAASAEPDPAPRRGQDSWEKEERTPPPGIAQGVRERVNRAMDTGARRHGGG
jgi:hypothetical protein